MDTYDLHLLPCVADVAVLRDEAHDRCAPLALVWTVALDVGRDVRLHEVPDLDAFSFYLRSPDAAAVLVEGVTKGIVRSNHTAAADVVITVGAENISGALLSCHGTLIGVGVQCDLVAREVGDRLYDVDLRVEVAIILIVVQEPTVLLLAGKNLKGYCFTVKTYKAGHMPQALAGRCAKSTMMMPLSMVLWLSRRTLLRPP